MRRCGEPDQRTGTRSDDRGAAAGRKQGQIIEGVFAEAGSQRGGQTDPPPPFLPAALKTRLRRNPELHGMLPVETLLLCSSDAQGTDVVTNPVGASMPPTHR